jgi:hypothetical protein
MQTGSGWAVSDGTAIMGLEMDAASQRAQLVDDVPIEPGILNDVRVSEHGYHRRIRVERQLGGRCRRHVYTLVKDVRESVCADTEGRSQFVQPVIGQAVIIEVERRGQKTLSRAQSKRADNVRQPCPQMTGVDTAVLVAHDNGNQHSVDIMFYKPSNMACERFYREANLVEHPTLAGLEDAAIRFGRENDGHVETFQERRQPPAEFVMKDGSGNPDG